ncbi:hypothetical protein C8R47DRAFT_1073234 [Mycena vitilis]|nr:hypothetical protein C8R47DRAFT_1073234 [Mycena vitilis]
MANMKKLIDNMAIPPTDHETTQIHIFSLKEGGESTRSGLKPVTLAKETVTLDGAPVTWRVVTEPPTCESILSSYSFSSASCGVSCASAAAQANAALSRDPNDPVNPTRFVRVTKDSRTFLRLRGQRRPGAASSWDRLDRLPCQANIAMSSPCISLGEEIGWRKNAAANGSGDACESASESGVGNESGVANENASVRDGENGTSSGSDGDEKASVNDGATDAIARATGVAGDRTSAVLENRMTFGADHALSATVS